MMFSSAELLVSILTLAISTVAAKVDLEQRGQSAIIGYRAVKAVC
jgi:hypothetical protein